jgi:hypothetical protein
MKIQRGSERILLFCGVIFILVFKGIGRQELNHSLMTK